MTLIQNTFGGLTCYGGSASSEIRMRIYDKGAESGDAPPGELWRWELQLRRKKAVGYAKALDSAPSRQSAVASLVHGHTSRLGLRTPDIPLGAAVIPAVDTSTDSSNTMRWLAEGVRPSIERLLNVYDRDTILAALGLAEPLRESDG